MGLMDLFNSFRSGAGADPARTPIPTVGADGNTTVPSADTAVKSDGSTKAFPSTADNKGEADPLAGYKDLWLPNTVKGADGKDVISTVIPPTLTPAMNVDAGKIMEAARTIDFTRALKAESLDKAAKGDAAAFAEVVNTIAQAAYGQGVLASTGIVQQAMTLQEQNFNQRVMPDILRKHSIRTTIAANPISENPAIAPLLSSIEQQLTTKYPTASPSEIKKHAETYLGGLAEEIVRGNGGTVVTKSEMDNASLNSVNRGIDTDWEKYFGVSTVS
jgi:hypothetical protein